MDQPKRVLWLDILKIVACFFVIINHTHGQLFNYAGMTRGTVLFDAFFFTVCKSAVPLFVMTSGYLLLQKGSSYSKTLTRILRILVPLLLLSVYDYITQWGTASGLSGFVHQFVAGPISVHFWYLYMLIGLYLATPFVAKMIRHFNTKDYSVFILLFLLIPSVMDLYQLCSGRYYSTFFLYAFFPGVLAYYIAGVFLAKLTLNRKGFWTAMLLYLVSVAAMAASIYVPFLKTGTASYSMDSWYALPVIVSSLALYYIFRYLFENKTFKPLSGKIIRDISATTFGIYLIHCLFNYKIYELGFVQAIYAFSPYVGVLFVEVTCFLFCGAIIYLLKKIPGVKRFL